MHDVPPVMQVDFNVPDSTLLVEEWNNQLGAIEITGAKTTSFRIIYGTHLDHHPSIPQSGGGDVKTFRWDNISLQRQTLFMAFNRVPRW